MNKAFPLKIIAGSFHLHADIGRMIHKSVESTGRIVTNRISSVGVSCGFEINRPAQALYGYIEHLVKERIG